MSSRLLFSVYDKQGDQYWPVITEKSRETAARAFTDAMMSGENELFSKWPADFTLFLVGSFDDETGLVTPLDKPELILTGEDIQRRANSSDPEGLPNV